MIVMGGRCIDMKGRFFMIVVDAALGDMSPSEVSLYGIFFLFGEFPPLVRWGGVPWFQ